MKKSKLKVTFHNPNTPEETANFLIKLCAKEFARNVLESMETSCQPSQSDPRSGKQETA